MIFDVHSSPEAFFAQGMAEVIHLNGKSPHARVNGRDKPAVSGEVFSAHDLGKMQFPPIRWAVPDLIPEGCTILAGRPKLGKSWLALDIALAVARGDYCLGDYQCDQGDAIYLALEDTPRRLKSRISKISPPHASDTWPAALDFATEWPRCEDGGLEKLYTWAKSKDNPRLIVVDVLAQFRSGRGNQEGLYESDYKAVHALQKLAGDLSISIIIVHHVRKGGSDIDPFEAVSGTMGLTGAADTTAILDRDGNGCSLYARGRDLEEYQKAIVFNKETCRWTVQGDAKDVRRSDERGAVLAALLDATDPMSPADIAVMADMPRNNAKQLLFKMAKAGEVVKAKRGYYTHPDKTEPVTSDDRQPPSNLDNQITNFPAKGGVNDD